MRGNFVNIPQNQREFVPDAWVPSQRSADAPGAAGQPRDTTPDPRVPLQWQGSTGFRVAHYIAATWVLAGLALSLGVYIFAAY
jgi:hypothetical protein